MNSVIIKEPRAFLQQVHLQTRMLTLKVGIDTSIYKFPGFVWHADHLRWERKEEIRLDFELQDEI